MTLTGAVAPYGDAAWRYRAAGWQGVIPIGYGPRRKNPPYKGYTGWTGLTPSGADVQAWVDGKQARWNVGLHIPPGVLVVDVDAYHGGATTLARLAEKVGHPLPATWTSTARGPGSPSRQLFYRAWAPPGRVWVDHPGGHRSGIDAIHAGHRYSVTWPSLNPDADNAEYRWYDLDGEWYEGVPQVSWLTVLDADWITVLSKEGTPVPGQAADDDTTNAAVARFPVGPPCAPVAAALRRELERIEAAGRGEGGLHDPGRIFALVALAVDKGHAGVAAALSQHQEAYVAARVEHRDESPDSAGQEWWRSVRGAVGKLLHASGGEVAQVCDCGRPAPPPPEVPAEAVPDRSAVEEAFVERQRMVKRAQRQIEAEEEQERAGQRKIRLTPASAFRIKAVKWVWEGRMPLGEITLIPGREGAGKSTFLAWMAAAITRGQLPGMYMDTPRAVLYAATEDSWEYTIAPRLLAAGADMNLVYRIDVQEVDAGRFGKLSMPVDNRALVEAAHEVKAGVLMCDPIISIIDDKINTFKAQELRSALEPLKRAAEAAEIALVGLVHFNKTKDTDVLSMISGSRAWAEVARAVVAIAVDKDAEEYTCVVSQVKNNLGRSDLPHLTYTIRSVTIRAAEHEAADEDVEIGALQWTGESDRGVEDLLAPKVESTRTGDVTNAVVAYVRERFTLSGRVPMGDISAKFPDETPENLRKVLSRAVNRGALKRPARGQYEPGDEPPRSCPGCQRLMTPGENFCRRCAQNLDAIDASARRALEDGW